MIITETRLKGAFLIEPEKLEDERGFFARTFDKKALRHHGIDFDLVESSISFNKKKGTLRGMHYQTEPYGEAKFVHCTGGSIFDVIIDLRPESKTFREWFGIELNAGNHKILYVPRGLVHGFMTLEDDSEVFYQIDQIYKPEHLRGVRWDDEAFKISWPAKPKVISTKDSSWKPLTT
jgi:dTDP-4-dehydrorhamnose 3,5-epimerase